MNGAKEPNILFGKRLGYSQRRCLVLIVFQWYNCTVHGEFLVVPVPDNIIYDGYNDNVSYTALLLPLFSDFWGGNWRCFDNIQVSELRAWLLGMIQYPVTLNCLFS